MLIVSIFSFFTFYRRWGNRYISSILNREAKFDFLGREFDFLKLLHKVPELSTI